VEQLAIRLGVTATDSIQWLLWSPNENEIIASGQLNNAEQLSTLTSKADKARVIGIVPSSNVGFKTVTLPAKSNRKVLQAIPFMLEEDIASDVSDLFFAYGQRQENQQQVVYCKRENLDAWQEMLAQAGIFCDTLVPDILCLPYTDGKAAIVQINEQIIVRLTEWTGIMGEAPWLWPVTTDKLIKQQQALMCFSELTPQAPQAIELEQDYRLLPMQLLLNGALSSPFNLLQGEYKIKRKSTGHWHRWKIAASLAVVALFINLLDKSIEVNQIKAEREAIREQISQTTQQGFPNLGKVLNHRRILAREVQKLEQGGGGLSMLVMLSQLAPVFTDTGVSPQSLRFDGARTELRMQSVANNFESLERFKRDAELLGFAVEQGAINNKGEQVTGSIVIKG